MQVLHLAQYLVNTFSPSSAGGITPLKLQKLLYYVKAWGLVAGRPLVPAPFRRWRLGPVNPDVYDAFKEYGGEPIPYMETVEEPRSEAKRLIDFIGTCYNPFSAVTLSAMTHKEDPWLETKPDEVIAEALMRAYYGEQPFALNFPFDPERSPFYPVQSDFGHAFTMDMDRRSKKDLVTYASYTAYLEHLQRASQDFDEWFSPLMK